MVTYSKNEVSILLRCKSTKACEVIRILKEELEEKGYLTPARGKIQAKYFCERFGLELDECQKLLKK